ncbi:hypothetical protein ACYTX9_09625, partial [Streptococcus pyogenes]
PAIEQLECASTETWRQELQILRSFAAMLYSDNRVTPTISDSGRGNMLDDGHTFAISLLSRMAHWRNGDILAFYKTRMTLPA